MEDLAVKEEEGAQGLLLGGGGEVFLHVQVGQECFHIGGGHFGGVAYIVKVDVALDPGGVGLLGADGVVLALRPTGGVPSAGSGQARTWFNCFFGRCSSMSPP